MPNSRADAKAALNTDPLRPLDGAFEGLRVLDFTQNLPGPYCTMLLAGLGAEVVKVEPPRGEPARVIGRIFDLVNGDKLSVTLDLKREDDRAKARELAKVADVLVEGFRPGVMERFGLDVASLHKDNPALIYCSISGFGQSGPYERYPAHDLNFQALTGVCHMMRDADDRPRGAALPLADLSSSMTAFGAIAAALYARTRDGRGRHLDVAMTDTLMSWAHTWSEGLTPASLGLGTGAEAALGWLKDRSEALPSALRPVASWIETQFGRLGVESKITETVADGLDAVGERVTDSDRYQRLRRVGLHALPHYGIYETKDHRWLSVGIVDEDKFWRALCEAMEVPALGRIPLVARFVSGPPLRKVLARIFAQQDMETWLERLDPASIPVAPVLPLDDAMTDPHFQARWGGAPTGGPAPLRSRPGAKAPALGADNDTVHQRWLGH